MVDLVSQWAYAGLRPLTMSKKAVCTFSVIVSGPPMPSARGSSSRMGVTGGGAGEERRRRDVDPVAGDALCTTSMPRSWRYAVMVVA